MLWADPTRGLHVVIVLYGAGYLRGHRAGLAKGMPHGAKRKMVPSEFVWIGINFGRSLPHLTMSRS
jgi:hypothetical protein